MKIIIAPHSTLGIIKICLLTTLFTYLLCVRLTGMPATEPMKKLMQQKSLIVIKIAKDWR